VSSKPQLTLSSKLIAYTPLVMVVAISPWQSLDSINLPKFLVLTTSAAALFGIGVLGENLRKYREMPRHIFAVYSLMILSMFLTVFLSGAPLIQQIYGVNGRNTGLIAYIALIILTLVSITNAQDQLSDKFVKNLIIGGQLTAIYCLIQYLGADPIDWNNPYSPILGFLGNPNFASAFLGISSVAAFTYLLSDTTKLKYKLICGAQILLSNFLIFLSQSQQGLLVFVAGTIVILSWKLYSSSKKLLLTLFLSGSLIGGVIGILGMLQVGPLTKFLYQSSITFRGDYWRAAIQMMREHPIFGVGLDSYGDWYRRSRSLEATDRRGPSVTSNAAHNVYLDMLANGGILLFVIYLASIILVILAVVRIVKIPRNLSNSNLAMIACWIAFQIQSIISINQLGLVVWGWVLSGLIIGIGIHAVPTTQKPQPLQTETAPIQVVAGFLTCLIGLAIAFPPFYASAKFKSALESRNADAIMVAAKAFPHDPVRLTSGAEIFTENKMREKAIELLKMSAEKFPADFHTWELISKSEYFSKSERNLALERLKYLDPHNSTLIVAGAN